MLGFILLPQPSLVRGLVTVAVWVRYMLAKKAFGLWLWYYFVIKGRERKSFRMGLKSVVFLLVHISYLLLIQS